MNIGSRIYGELDNSSVVDVCSDIVECIARNLSRPVARHRQQMVGVCMYHLQHRDALGNTA